VIVASLVPVEVVVVAAVLGVVAVGTCWRRPGDAPEAAAVLGAGYLAWDHQIPWIVAVAVVAAAATSLVAGRARPGARGAVVGVGAVAACGLLVVAPPSTTGPALALAVAAVVGGHLLLAADSGRWCGPILALAVAGATAATVLGGPDTEGGWAAAAALLPALALTAPPRPRRPGPLAPIVLVAWVAVDAYRGRPGGLPAAAVALAALVVGAALVGRARPGPGLVAAALAAAAAVAAARGIGLDAEATGTDWALAAGSSAALALVSLAAVTRPGRAGTPPG
jgi:hypothetical protein